MSNPSEATGIFDQSSAARRPRPEHKRPSMLKSAVFGFADGALFVLALAVFFVHMTFFTIVALSIDTIDVLIALFRQLSPGRARSRQMGSHSQPR
ncbi:MAG: hypothetical protein ACRBCL_03745 [Maritimibacter sp.]